MPFWAPWHTARHATPCGGARASGPHLAGAACFWEWGLPVPGSRPHSCPLTWVRKPRGEGKGGEQRDHICVSVFLPHAAPREEGGAGELGLHFCLDSPSWAG